MMLSELGEEGFLEKLLERVREPGPDVKLGIGDDAAALTIPPGENTLFRRTCSSKAFTSHAGLFPPAS